MKSYSPSLLNYWISTSLTGYPDGRTTYMRSTLYLYKDGINLAIPGMKNRLINDIDVLMIIITAGNIVIWFSKHVILIVPF